MYSWDWLCTLIPKKWPRVQSFFAHGQPQQVIHLRPFYDDRCFIHISRVAEMTIATIIIRTERPAAIIRTSHVFFSSRTLFPFSAYYVMTNPRRPSSFLQLFKPFINYFKSMDSVLWSCNLRIAVLLKGLDNYGT
jgi:hypothetical protein